MGIGSEACIMTDLGLMLDFQELIGFPQTFAGEIIFYVLFAIFVFVIFVLVILIPITLLHR